jgi:hypothetical protein
MTILLQSVAFDHQLPWHAGQALHLRRNGSRALPVPEWQRGVSVHAEDSLAAYALESVRGTSIRVAAEFVNLSPLSLAVQVRAIALREEFAPSVLSDIAARLVFFSGSSASGPQIFETTLPISPAIGVGSHTLRWRWEFRITPFESWRPFALTQHRIFTILREPTLPWIQTVAQFNTQLPWTDVLEHACVWAAGAQDVAEAARRITRAVNSLGGGLLFYDCPGLGGTHYTRYTPAVVFECTDFLELLNGGVGNGALVNCVDCAAITSTFANILGCDLSQSGMFDQLGRTFELNPILAIGSDVWQPACGWPGFGYHEVAWEGTCTAVNDVYDSCLQLNGGDDPAGQPRVPLLPADIRFGAVGQREYRDRLCTPAGRPKCEPQPATTRRRRPVI